MTPTKSLSLLFLCIFIFFNVTAQELKTFAERLGYKKNDKVVILHVDDAGMSYESNQGAIQALTKGVASSCSVMMPCPWVPGFVRFLHENPKIDAGLHLTLNSEWRDYRWLPVSGKPAVPGLVDREGAMWASVEDVVKNASADEVEREIRAQLQRARDMGFEPTHLDSHMGTLFAKPEYLQRYIKMGVEEKIPVMLPAGHATLIQQQVQLSEDAMKQIRMAGEMIWNAGLPVLDDLHNESYTWKPQQEDKVSDRQFSKTATENYKKALASIRPGITMIIMHCTAKSEIFQHISDSGPVRRADLMAMLDPELRNYIKEQGIIITTWRELHEKRKQLQ